MKICNLILALSIVTFFTGCYKNSSSLCPTPTDEKTNSNGAFLVESYIKTDQTFNLPNKYINLEKYRSYIEKKINSLRTRKDSKAKEVRMNRNLTLAASYHAKDMAVNNLLSHKGSGTKTDVARERNGKGSQFFERVIFFGYPLKPKKKTGEIITYTKLNIVGTSNVLANFDHAIENFMKSPQHCAVLMDPRFNDFGIGAYQSKDKIYWVIDFAQR